MQRVSFGEPWWAAKKKELYLRAQVERDAVAREKAENERRLQKRHQMKDAQAAITMDLRVRERMGPWKYALMPWKRGEVAEELEVYDRMVAELDD